MNVWKFIESLDACELVSFDPVGEIRLDTCMNTGRLRSDAPGPDIDICDGVSASI